MSKKKTVTEIETVVEIKAAALKDLFCNYNYEFKIGVNAGDAVKHTGSSIVHEDMQNAFAKLNVHLAVICEEIDTSLIVDVEKIEAFDNEIHNYSSIECKVSNFKVNSFFIDGVGENESVRLVGTKKLTTQDCVELKTPKIVFENNYQFSHELRAAVDLAKEEVLLYMQGKTAPKMVQQEIDFEPEN